LRYDGVNFILQGKGGVKLTGNAGDAQVLSGYTYYNTDPKTKRVGTMPSNGSQAATLQITGSAKPTKTVPAGYTPGGTITAELAPALASKIVAGETVGGVAGLAVKINPVAGDILIYSETAGTGSMATTPTPIRKWVKLNYTNTTLTPMEPYFLLEHIIYTTNQIRPRRVQKELLVRSFSLSSM
ncbi:MAG: hypothetical protein AAGU75_18305, partial [Bacillota bacterium]